MAADASNQDKAKSSYAFLEGVFPPRHSRERFDGQGIYDFFAKHFAHMLSVKREGNTIVFFPVEQKKEEEKQ